MQPEPIPLIAAMMVYGVPYSAVPESGRQEYEGPRQVCVATLFTTWVMGAEVDPA